MPTTRSRFRALGGLLACLVVATALSVVPATRAAAAPPTNLSPSGGETVVGIPVFSWDRVTGAASYDIQVAATDTFATPLVSLTGTVNRQYVPPRRLPAGPLYWRVRVNGAGDAWATETFTVGVSAAPTVTGPADGVQLPQPASPPVLTWDPVSGSDSYEVQYGTDPNFVDQTTTQTTESTSYVVGLQAPGVYNWRVRAVLAAGITTAWSAGRTYQVLGLSPPAGEPQYPNDDINQDIQDVVLDWDPIAGAKLYDLQISTDSNFLTFTEQVNIHGTRYSPTSTLGNDQYYWRVRPADAAANKLDWTQVPIWRFRRSWPSQPSLQYPAHGSTVGDPFYFQWTPVELASKYTVEVSPNPSFAPANQVVRCTTVHTTLAKGDETAGDACFPGALGTYYWRVKASDELGATPPVTDVISAQVRQFTYHPGLVDTTAPANGATLTVPTLRWNPFPGASKYRVTLTGNGDILTFTTPSTSFTVRDLPPGTYQWEVRTLDERNRLGVGVLLSAQPSFTLAAYTGPTYAAPDPSPAAVGAGYRFPTLKWLPVTNVDFYTINVRRAGTQGWSAVNAYFLFTAGEDTSTTHLSPGDYEWHVEAHLLGGGTVSGGVGTFTINELPAVDTTTYRAALAGNGLTGNVATTLDTCDATLPATCQNLRQTPVLGWASPAPNVGYYQLYIARDKELTNLVEPPIMVTSTMYVDIAALADSQAGSAYFWEVVPCTTAGFCRPPAHAEHAFNKQSRPLTLVSPADGAQVANDVTFTWDDYLVSQAVVDGPQDPDTGTPLNTPASTEARHYRIQTSTDPNFTTGVTTTTVDQRTFTSFTDTYPEGTNYWRVQAVDGSNNQLAWSQTRSFVKQSPVPTPSLPAPDATVPGNSTLSWQPLHFAATYVVEVYKASGGVPDTVPNAANRVLNATTTRVTHVLDNLDPALGPYTWRVRRNDAKNRPGGWSALRTFSVTAPAVPLVSPAPSAQVEPSDGLFTWAAIAEATKYKFERRLVGGSTVAETVTTPALSWAPTAAIAGGSWEWRVTGLDSAGNLLEPSAWRPFTVIDTPSATVPVSISGSGKVGTPLTLTPPTWNMPPATVTTTYQWYRGTSALAGQTGLTYDVVSADVGKAITVKATGTRPGYKTGSSTSNAIVGVLGDTVAPAVPPSISGIPAARETLTAEPGDWGSGVTFTYQWFVNGLAVARETKGTYVVRTRDAGLPVKVRVTANKTGFVPGEAYSNELTVKKLSTTTTASLEAKKISRRARGVLLVHVEVLDLGVPLGKVQVRKGTKVLATVTLKNDSRGDLTIRLKKLPPGKHKLKVSYLGSTATMSSVARKVILIVLRS